MRGKKTKSPTKHPAALADPLGTAASYREAEARTGYPDSWIRAACDSVGARTPSGRIDLDKVREWINANTPELEKLKDQLPLKEQKLVEEIRQLRLKNDQKDGALVLKSWVSERFQRAAGDVNAVRVRLESVEPVKLAEAAGDIPKLRVIYRAGIDELMGAFLDCGKHFE